MPAPQEVSELIERFDRNREAYLSNEYNEAQVRLELINPFFKALGWDMYNEAGYAEAYKDVVHEDAIKIGGVTKAPDYAFRIGGMRKFFVEAKRPGVNIKNDPDPAYQLRRYAWSAKLPLSILTDFEEFAVYDCRIKPNQADKASVARVLYFTYKEYEARWDEITAIFSREAILKGSFDKYVESSKKKRGTAEVDDAFLKEIENWRDLLARNIALRNPDLSTRELNYAVQRTIDRIIFLRICEDRGVESYGQLRGLQNGAQVYPRLCQIFRHADERYNSGLFHFSKEKDRTDLPDDLTLGLTIDDKALKEIFKGLYYPESPFEFSVLPADILGHIYEQFLGKVIRLTAGHHAKVEDKPEVKKAGGVYYTPTYIVDYIVKNTVGKLLEGKTPNQVAKLRVLDPACGSGSFLLGAYQYLLNWHQKWYQEHDPEKHGKGRSPKVYLGPGSEWRLTTAEKKRILLNNIYGVDIDTQAVEVTKLSLLLKVLEGENAETLGKSIKLFHERALPDLGENIKCGNSLIGPDFYEGQQLSLLDDEERYRINAFDWNAEFPEIMNVGGFDAVIGNPPYDVLEKDRGKSSWPHEALLGYIKRTSSYESALGGKLNMFRFFLIQGLHLTCAGGRYGMIMPLSLLADISCANARRHLMCFSSELQADCFPQKDDPNRRVFRRAKLSTAVYTCLKKDRPSDLRASVRVRTYPGRLFSEGHKECLVRYQDASLLDEKNLPIPLANEADWGLCLRLHKAAHVKHLGMIAGYQIARGEINQTIFRRYIVDDPDMTRLIKGVEVGRYQERENLSQGKREWFDETSYVAKKGERPIIRRERIATQRITGVDEKLRIVASLISPPAYFADSTNSISLTQRSEYTLEYLLGLLNSALFQWRFKLTSTNNNVATNELKSLPFRVIDFTIQDERCDHDRMVELVETMLKLHKDLQVAKTNHEKSLIQRQIDATDKQIDQLVYELYGLSEEEIKIVEEETCG